MIGALYHRRSSTITSVPSMSGRPRSRITASGGWLAARATASRPVPPPATAHPPAPRLARGQRPRLAARPRRDHVVLPGPQVDAQRPEKIGLILDDEDRVGPG